MSKALSAVNQGNFLSKALSAVNQDVTLTSSVCPAYVLINEPCTSLIAISRPIFIITISHPGTTLTDEDDLHLWPSPKWRLYPVRFSQRRLFVFRFPRATYLSLELEVMAVWSLNSPMLFPSFVQRRSSPRLPSLKNHFLKVAKSFVKSFSSNCTARPHCPGYTSP